jgi:hypothetical protein
MFIREEASFSRISVGICICFAGGSLTTRVENWENGP